jgi:ribosomal protein S18 acetylase RimI-like enzyme
VSDQLYAGVDEIYRAHGVKIPSRAFPLLMVLRDHGGTLTIGELADHLGVSHVAILRGENELDRAGVTGGAKHPKDGRSSVIHLLPKGRALLERLEPVWRAIVKAVDGIDAAADTLLPTVRKIEEALEERSFAERVDAELKVNRRDVEIVPYEASHREHFKRLNIEWLEKHFYVEAIDHEVLGHPEKILAKGGAILLAERGDEVVGTVALIRHPRNRYELSKMAVTERHQGQGIGHQLLRAAIARFEELGGGQLFLETNHKLLPAIRLYEDNGFVRAERPKGPIHYARSDVYMLFSRARTGGSKRRRARRAAR